MLYLKASLSSSVLSMAGPMSLGSKQLLQLISARADARALLSRLAGHYYDRIAVTSVGCFIWGTMTTGFAFCTSIGQGMFFWAVNGIGMGTPALSGLGLFAM